MPIHEYEVRFFLEIDGDEEDPLAIEEAVTEIFDEEVHHHVAHKATRCGIRFHDVTDVTVTKT